MGAEALWVMILWVCVSVPVTVDTFCYIERVPEYSTERVCGKARAEQLASRPQVRHVICVVEEEE